TRFSRDWSSDVCSSDLTRARTQRQATVRRPGRWPGDGGWNRSWRSFLHPHFAEHAGFHVVEQVAVVGPAAKGIRSHPVAALGAWWHVDGVLAHHEVAGFILEVAPHAVEVDRVRHHRVVDQHDPHALAVVEAQGLRVSELHSVKGPGESLHVAGQVQLDRAAGFTRSEER